MRLKGARQISKNHSEMAFDQIVSNKNSNKLSVSGLFSSLSLSSSLEDFGFESLYIFKVTLN